MKTQIAYFPIGVPTYHLETAGNLFSQSKKMLSEIAGEKGLSEEQLKAPKEMLLTMDLLKQYADTIEPDLVIVQNTTFANGAYMAYILNRFDVPVILWTLREAQADGGRLKLNSLTGAYSAANTMRNMGKGIYSYVFGNPSEDAVKEKIAKAIQTKLLVDELKTARIASIGHTPDGFGFGRALDGDLLKTFGVTQVCVEARQLMKTADSYKDEEVTEELLEANRVMPGFEKTPEEHRIGYAKLLKAYREFVKNENVQAISSRCWPDYFTEYKTPVCAVLSMMGELGVPAACETDTYGALSMLIGVRLSGNAVFFGDPVAMDPEENSVTYWHCGMAAPGLANDCADDIVSVHCNRQMGPTMEFGCKGSNQATVFRVGRNPDGTHRLFLASGEAISKPMQYHGTSVVVKLNHSVEDMVNETVLAGWEPHFVVIYGDYAEEIQNLGTLLGIEVKQYR